MWPRLGWLWFALLLPPFVLAHPVFEARAHAIHGNDGLLNYAYARSILIGGDLDFTDDYGFFDRVASDRAYGYRLSDTPVDPATGRPVNRYGWGSSLLWAPSLVVAHLLSLMTPAIANDAMTPLHFLAVRLGSALWGVLGLVGLVAVARRHLAPGGGRDEAMLAICALATVLCTNLGFYLYLHPSMSTAPAFGLAGLLVWQTDRLAVQRSTARWFALGLTSGLLICTRYGDAALLVGLLPALWAADRAGGEREAGIGRPMAGPGFLAGLAPIALVQMWIWNSLYGSPLSGPAPYLGDDYAWSFPGRHSLAVLISFHHGWLSWHPTVLLGLIGLVMLARDNALPLWLRLTPLAVLTQLIAVGAWPEWTGGASFGGRLMATALVVVFFGLVVALRWIRDRWGLRWVVTLVVLLALWNLGLLAQYASEMIARQGPVSPPEVLRNNGHLLWELLTR